MPFIVLLAKMVPKPLPLFMANARWKVWRMPLSGSSKRREQGSCPWLVYDDAAFLARRCSHGVSLFCNCAGQHVEPIVSAECNEYQSFSATNTPAQLQDPSESPDCGVKDSTIHSFNFV